MSIFTDSGLLWNKTDLVVGKGKGKNSTLLNRETVDVTEFCFQIFGLWCNFWWFPQNIFKSIQQC